MTPIYASEYAIEMFNQEFDSDGYYNVEGDHLVAGTSDDYDVYFDFEDDKIDIYLKDVQSESDITINGPSYTYDPMPINFIVSGHNKMGSIFNVHNVTVSGDGSLELIDIYGKGSNQDSFTVTEGTNVSIAYFSIGASGGVDGKLVVNGNVILSGGYFGVLEIGSTGILELYGSITLNGSIDNNGSVQYHNTLVITSGGQLIADCEDPAIMIETVSPENFDDGSFSADNAIILASNYLPNDLIVIYVPQEYSGFITFVYDTGNETYVKEDGAKQFHLQQYYTITTQDCESSQKLAAAGDEITLTPNEAPANQTFKGYEFDTSVAETANGFIMPDANVQVKAVYEDIVMSSLTLNEDELTFDALNESFQLIATYAPEDVADATLVWTSSDEAVATVENGLVTAVSEGTATITVKNEASGLSATCNVKVALVDDEDDKNDNVVSYNIITHDCSSDVESAIPGTLVTLTPYQKVGYVFDHYESEVDIEFDGNTFIMPETDLMVWVVYQEIKMNQLDLDEEELKFNKLDEEYQLEVNFEPEDSNKQDLKWTSSDKKVVEVDKNGKITIKGEGTAIITVENEVSGLSDTCTIIVELEKDEVDDGAEDEAIVQPEEEESQEETPIVKDEDKDIPPTSDTTNITLYYILLMMSIIAMGTCIYLGKKES